MTEALLLSVCGDPLGVVPAGNSLAWRGAGSALRHCLGAHGIKARFRSWEVLWKTLYASPPPIVTSWHDLLGEHTVATLAASVLAGRTKGMRAFASWNARWMKDAHSKNVQAKKGLIENALVAGRPVLLQETHWDAGAAGT